MDTVVFWYIKHAHLCYGLLIMFKLVHFLKNNKGPWFNFLFFSSTEITYTKDKTRQEFKKTQNWLSFFAATFIIVHLFFIFSVFSYDVSLHGIKIWRKQ